MSIEHPPQEDVRHYSRNAFLNEVRSVIERELSGEKGSRHFLVEGSNELTTAPDLDVSLLTDEDQETYRAIKDASPDNQTFDIKSFDAYRDAISALDDTDPAKQTRIIFSQYLTNLAPGAWVRQGRLKNVTPKEQSL